MIDQVVLDKSNWINNKDIRPYIFVRNENAISNPGSLHRLNWFKNTEPVIKNPLDLNEITFADRIYSIEERAFGPSNMAMPRWVFYDCAVLPGFVAGYCMRPSAMSKELKKVMSLQDFPATGSPTLNTPEKILPRRKNLDDMDWVPLSLFIIIPTMNKGEWVAHNLCSVNSLLSRENQFYGLGFLSKAFGLWYANVEKCTGITQWGSPAIKLHSHYGHMEILGAYAPVHSHAKTLTYRLKVKTDLWEKFFTKDEDLSFLENYEKSGDQVDPEDEETMIQLQRRIEEKNRTYFISAMEVAKKKLKEPFNIFQTKEAL